MKRNLKVTVSLFGLFIVVVIFNGCMKEISCSTNSGDITIFNYHDDPYKLLVDDSLISILQPWDSIFLVYKNGIETKFYNFKMIQESGYDSIPNIFEAGIGIDPCTSTAWTP